MNPNVQAMSAITHEDVIRSLSALCGAVVLTGLDGVIVYASPGIHALSGYQPGELIGQHTRIFKADLNPSDVYDDLWETILSKQAWKGLLRNKKKDGTVYLERLTIIPISGDDGELRYFAALKEAAGEQPEAAERNELQAARENAENVLATVVNLSSEFQSSLQMVVGFAQILNDDLDHTLTGDQREYFGIVIRAVQRLLRTLDDTVLLARLESGIVEFNPVSFNVAEELRMLLAKMFHLNNSEQVRFIKVIEDNGAEIKVDRNSFATVVSHLLINAMKFTKEGSITIGLQNQNNQAVVWVIDTGVGISEQFKPKLFESFKQEELGFNREFEGAGLGLAITRQLVHKMGGTITFESYKGSGSTFIVSFPIVGWEDRLAHIPENK